MGSSDDGGLSMWRSVNSQVKVKSQEFELDIGGRETCLVLPHLGDVENSWITDKCPTTTTTMYYHHL